MYPDLAVEKCQIGMIEALMSVSNGPINQNPPSKRQTGAYESATRKRPKAGPCGTPHILINNK